jgi:hypothetical protein
MPRGGRRTGAGRKPGSLNVRSREIAERAAAEGITPLEVMLQAMRQRWDGGDVDGAVSAAEKAAPYVHARLAAVDSNVSGELATTLTVVSGVERDED